MKDKAFDHLYVTETPDKPKVKTEPKFRVQPLFDRVLLKPVESESMKAGLYIPDSAKEKKSQATIKAVGTSQACKESGLKVGDLVLFNKYAGEEFKVDDEDYLLMDVSEITAILEEIKHEN